MTAPRSWPEVRQLLEGLPFGRKVFLPAELGHPRDAGAVLSVGLPAGQRADWRFPPAADCSGLHVHEYPHGWVAHLDQVHPECGLIPHLQADAPGVLLLAGSVAGLLLGTFARRPTTGLLVGLLVGGALASGGQQQLRLRQPSSRPQPSSR